MSEQDEKYMQAALKLAQRGIGAEIVRTLARCGADVALNYRKSADESESPRGRIALIQGLVSGALADSPRAHAHLDRCLECRACESACPSGVPFGRIMDAARAWHVERLPWIRRRLRKGLLEFLASRTDSGATTGHIPLKGNGLWRGGRGGAERLLKLSGVDLFTRN